MNLEEQIQKYEQEKIRLIHITNYIASQHTEYKEQLKAINIVLKEKKGRRKTKK